MLIVDFLFRQTSKIRSVISDEFRIIILPKAQRKHNSNGEENTDQNVHESGCERYLVSIDNVECDIKESSERPNDINDPPDCDAGGPEVAMLLELGIAPELVLVASIALLPTYSGPGENV